MSAGPTTEMSKTNAKQLEKKVSPAGTFRDLLEYMKPQLQEALPKHIDIDRMLRICMSTVKRNPKLLDCTQESLLSCIFSCVQLGLEPDGLLGHAYLIPFKDNRKNVSICTLIVGYKGLLKLARQSNEISSVSARVVYTNDVFDYEFGLEEKLIHKPITDGHPGELSFAYAVFRYKDGGHHFDVMSKVEIDAIRERSKSKDDGPWVTDYDEMAKKTVLRRASKMAPASIEDLARAIAIDSRSDAGFAPALDFALPAAELPGQDPAEQGRRLSLARKPDATPPPAAAQAAPQGASAPATPPAEFQMSTSKQRRDITAGAAAAHVDMLDVCKWFGVGNIAELSFQQAEDALAKLRTVTGEGAADREPGSDG